MTATRKARVPMAEQIRLINECRQSGMTDADWCRENDIAVSTFYNWVSRCRKAAADQIPAPNYGHCEIPRSKQDVVPIDIVSDHLPEQHTVCLLYTSCLYTHKSFFIFRGSLHRLYVVICEVSLIYGIHCPDAPPV